MSPNAAWALCYFDSLGAISPAMVLSCAQAPFHIFISLVLHADAAQTEHVALTLGASAHVRSLHTAARVSQLTSGASILLHVYPSSRVPQPTPSMSLWPATCTSGSSHLPRWHAHLRVFYALRPARPVYVRCAQHCHWVSFRINFAPPFAPNFTLK